jgi:hypothetical protein
MAILNMDYDEIKQAHGAKSFAFRALGFDPILFSFEKIDGPRLASQTGHYLVAFTQRDQLS